MIIWGKILQNNVNAVVEANLVTVIKSTVQCDSEIYSTEISYIY